MVKTFSYSEYDFVEKVGLNPKMWSIDYVSVNAKWDIPVFHIGLFNDKVDADFNIPMEIIPEIKQFIDETTKVVSVNGDACGIEIVLEKA